MLGFEASCSQCGLCPHVIPPLSGRNWIVLPDSQHPVHATAPMQHKPIGPIHVLWAGDKIGHGQNVFHLTPLQQICPSKNLKWVFEPNRYLRSPTMYSPIASAYGKGQKMKVWILFLQWSKCIPINLKRTPKIFNGKFEGFYVFHNGHRVCRSR